MLGLHTESEFSYIGARAKLAPGQSVRTDSDSVQISTDSIGLRAIPHRNGVEYVGESKDLQLCIQILTIYHPFLRDAIVNTIMQCTEHIILDVYSKAEKSLPQNSKYW